MKNAYSPIDRLAAELTRPKGTGAEFMTELSKKPGYKQAEVEDRELQTLMALPKMAREEFLAALKAKSAVVPREWTLSGSPGGLSHAEMMEREASGQTEEDTHHEEYTLPGGENYREILLKHPKGGFKGVAGHFGGEGGILASIRVKDRTGPNGEKILHLEEIQSDWHQKGREKGYMPKGVDPEQEVKKAGAAYGQLYSKWAEAKSASVAAEAALKSDRPLYQDPEVRARYTEALREHNNQIMDLTPQLMKADEARRKATEMSNYGIPDAPFKKNWHELALKRMIQHAAEKGYDQIAITPGEEQAKRYKLSQHVGTVSYNPDEQHFQAFKPNRETLINEKDASPERVAELIGKDAATRLMSAPQQMGHHFLEGENLDVGGEGMKGFYDKMVPKFLNQFGKKYGAQVQPGAVSIVSTPAQHHGLTEGQFQRQPPEEQERMVRQHAYAHEGAKTAVPVHTFPITPEMREDVTKNGIPLYAKGGEVDAHPTIKWTEPKQTKIAAKDDLTGTSPWSQNTYGGASRLLYGEMHHGDKLIGRAMLGIHDDPKMLEIDKVWVDKAHRRSGHASHMIEEAKAKTGIKNVWAPHTTDEGQKFMESHDKKNSIKRAKGGEVEVRPTVKDETIQRKIPEMEAAAKALQAGIIDRKEYDRTIKKHKPVKPYDFVPQPASDEDADRALMENKKPQWRGHSKWPAGRKVGLRLDIPAYETHGVWVNSIHDEEGREGDKLKTSYAPVSSVKNATFDASPEKAVKVATGEQNKSPFARIKGELHHMTEDEAVEHMKEHLNNPEYAQVGMDPRRHGYFYDRKTMKPVSHSEHVVQIGPLVLAKNPKYGKRETYATGGAVSRETIKPVAHGIIKERVTVSPDKDVMMYELMSAKHFTKKVK